MEQVMKEKNTGNGTKQYLTFQLANEVYGLELTNAREIIKMTKMTNLPNSAEYIMGVINLRGQIVPVIDIKKKLGLTTFSDIPLKTKRIAIVEYKDLLLGLLIDGVSEVVRIADEELENLSDTNKGLNQEYIQGVYKSNNQLIVIFSLEKILREKDVVKEGRYYDR